MLNRINGDALNFAQHHIMARLAD
ncbi:hypothetical protein VCNHCC004A_001467A, partial [Vibrio cholerae O1 str. NHCC-004A]